MPDTPILDDSDPFEVFESVPEILAYIHKQEGAEGVNELLQALIAVEQVNPTSRESLRGYASELEGLGFMTLVQLVRDAAKQARPKAKLDPHCPHTPADGLHFIHFYRSQGLPVPKWARARLSR